MSDRFDEGRAWGQVREQVAILTMLRAQAANADGEFNADYVATVRHIVDDIVAGAHKPYYPATPRFAS